MLKWAGVDSSHSVPHLDGAERARLEPSRIVPPKGGYLLKQDCPQFGEALGQPACGQAPERACRRPQDAHLFGRPNGRRTVASPRPALSAHLNSPSVSQSGQKTH